MPFGQLVIGPPGSGKSSYCRAAAALLRGQGRRVSLVNLDPASEGAGAEVDVRALVSLGEVMGALGLGPNGGILQCMELLEGATPWLLQRMRSAPPDTYFLVDCPGQVELYTHHDSVRGVVRALERGGFVLSAVHLVDSHHCSDPAKFMAVLLTSLATMLKMEMPHINVLSKTDLMDEQGRLHFNLDFYTEVLDLSELVDLLSDDPFLSRYKKLNAALMEVVENYGLVSFHTLSIKDEDSLKRVIRAADKASGHQFSINQENRDVQSLLATALQTDRTEGDR